MKKIAILISAILSFSACSEESVTPQSTTQDPDASSCNEGYRRCKDNFVQSCESGEWKNTDACPYGCDTKKIACLPESGEIPDPPDSKCQNGDIQCKDDTLSTCQDGEWLSKNCEFGCAASANACAECRDNRCIGDEKSICEDGFWVQTIVPCPNGCNEAGTDCAPPKDCTEGQMLCSDKQLKQCTGNTWSTVKECPDGCNAEQTDCMIKECTDGDSICADGNVKNCMDSTWSSPAPCPYGCDEAGKVCAEQNQNQPTRYLMKNRISPITPYVIEQMKAIAAKNTSRDGNVFMKVGDSHYDADILNNHWNYGFMTCFSTQDKDTVTLDSHTELQTVIDAFQSKVDSFIRDSDTAVGGKMTNYVLSENRLENEINEINPRFALFGFGTNDVNAGGNSYTTVSGVGNGYPAALQLYYQRVNKALDIMMNAGVIPLISGVAPNSKTPASNKGDQPQYAVPLFDAVSRGIAEHRQIPWYDTFNDFMPLPSHGLQDDKIHESKKGSPCNFTPEGLQYGANVRNLGTITMLYYSWQTVVNNIAPTDTIEEPFAGAGSPSDPYLITSLPYTHAANTTESSNSFIDVYTACKDSPEYGPEVYYKLVLDKKTRVKIFAVSSQNADLDIHVLKDGTTADNCFRRADIFMQGYMEPGTYYIVVDSYGKSGASKPGEYLMGVVECLSDDPNCDVELKSY